MISTSQGRYCASLSVEAINPLLDVELTGLSKPRKGSIPFSVFIVGEEGDVSSSLFQRNPLSIDLCDYLNGQQYPTRRLYFCPKAYPPPTNNADMAGKNAKEYQGWKDLKRDFAFLRIKRVILLCPMETKTGSCQDLPVVLTSEKPSQRLSRFQRRTH